jgi:ferredoxin
VTRSETGTSDSVFLARPRLQELIDALLAQGYRVVAPVARAGAVVFDSIASAEELPRGLRETQEPGRYRLEPSGNGRLFDVVNGPGSLKPFFFAPREPLLQIRLEGDGFEAREKLPEPLPTALLGVRACDLAALGVQDRIFLSDHFPDPWYAARRRDVLLIAVNCVRSATTCFCTSMGTGPEAREGFDLVLTEEEDGFVARAGSGAGGELLASLGLPAAGSERLQVERAALAACARGIERRLETHDLPGLLYANLDHPRWQETAERCLSCGNCTLVCPTCFCHDELDEPALDGNGSVRVRQWDSCFDRQHAQVHGLNFRPQIAHRYRQWLVHKLASWIDQFGESGCVGCGRCITWCPVGIDLSEEVAAIRGSEP